MYILTWSHLMHNQSPPTVHEIPLATSRVPQGPYTRVTPLRTKGVPGSTIGLWLDQDTGKGYARYNSALGNCIEELASDFLSTTGRNSCVAAANGEGGGYFKRGSSYYLMTGFGCCFCPAGADALVYVSHDGPLGNYTYVAEINPATNPNANKLPPAVTPPPPPAPPSSKLCDMRGVWAAYGPKAWGANQTITQEGSTITVWDGPAFFYPCGKPTGCKPNPYFANGTVFANRTVRMTKSGAVGNISAFNASSGDCTLISFGETERWGRAPWVTYKDYTHPDYLVPAQQFNVITLPEAGGGHKFLFFGERWPDGDSRGINAPANGTKAGGLQALVPLEFDSQGTPLPMKGMPEFTLNLTRAKRD